MEVREGGEDLDDVGDRLVDRDRREGAAVRLHPRLEHLVQRTPADVLHHDVRRAVGRRHEVVDLHDEWVFDLGEVLLLADRCSCRIGVASVEQALEHDPAIVDVAVLGEVDPAHPTVGEAADDLVLAADERTEGELRLEVERRPALRAETLAAARLIAS